MSTTVPHLPPRATGSRKILLGICFLSEFLDPVQRISGAISDGHRRQRLQNTVCILLTVGRVLVEPCITEYEYPMVLCSANQASGTLHDCSDCFWQGDCSETRHIVLLRVLRTCGDDRIIRRWERHLVNHNAEARISLETHACPQCTSTHEHAVLIITESCRQSLQILSGLLSQDGVVLADLIVQNLADRIDVLP